MTKLIPLAFVFVGCGGNKAPSVPDVTATSSADVVSEAAVIEVQAPVEDPKKALLTRANQRLIAGRKAYDERDYPKAIFEAQRGIDILGADYAPANIGDESAAKLELAKQRAEQNPADGSTIYLRMLEDRIELAKKHWDRVP